MSARLKADGDTWEARLGERRGSEAALVFFCRTTDQRPWRVVPVDAERFPTEADVDRLPEKELRDLFGASRSMGVPRDYPTYS